MAEKRKTGLDRARELYENRGVRAAELAAQGKKVIGYFCCFMPLEFATALDAVPYRMHGKVGQDVERADSYLETLLCPFVRSCFEQVLIGKYDFLSGLVVPHTCDAHDRSYPVYRYNSAIKIPFVYSYIIPNMLRPASFRFFAEELKAFKESLERHCGRTITEEALAAAIAAHNQNRALLRELYDLRKSEPPLVSGSEIVQVLVAGMTIPVEEGNQLLREVITEVKQRDCRDLASKPRLLLYGSEVDDVAFVQLVEQCGGHVVMDDICIGSRAFWHDVPTGGDLLENLAQRYLGTIHCPRTYFGVTGQERYGYLGEFVRDYGVQAAILYTYQYCDSHGIEVPVIRDYLTALGVPTLHIEDVYFAPSIEQLRTRVEAFLEMLPTPNPAMSRK